MPSADFCLITYRVTPVGAIGFHLFRSYQSMGTDKPRLDPPVASLVICRLHVKQISPDKSMNFPCTAASFTAAVRSRGFDVL
ncbi:MAG: hypothetical protein L3J62_10740, partial [Gammaproteobacteria bacterium]|nr:hypothetical protein [Gammaproteobacteria bacterium]